MSYYTQLQLTWEDDGASLERLEVDRIVEAAAAVASEMNWSADILGDVRSACDSSILSPPGFNDLQAHGVIHLVREISSKFPEATFYAKGCGEAHWDVWIRTFRAGQVMLERGPFDELEPPMPEELLASAKAAGIAAQGKVRKGRWWRRLVGDA